MTSDKRQQRGFTLVEVTVVLMALAVLAAVLVPSVGNLNGLARKVRLKEDLGVLCSSLKMMLDDLGGSAFFESYSYGSYARTSSGFAYGSSYAASRAGQMTVTQQTERDVAYGAEDEWCEDCDMPARDCGPDCMEDCGPDCYGRHDCGPDCYARERADVTTQTYSFQGGSGYSSGYGASYASSSAYRSVGSAFYGFPIGLLVGDGDVPSSAIGPTEWQLTPGSRFAATTNGYYPVSLQFSVATFADQLIHRDPTLPQQRAYAAGYGRYGYGGYGGYGYGNHLVRDRTYRWRGPYIADAVAPDPWGNRYMANVFSLHVPSATLYPVNIGAAGYVEGFTSAVVCYGAGPNGIIETHFNQPFGWYTGGDDVTVVLAGAGGL